MNKKIFVNNKVGDDKNSGLDLGSELKTIKASILRISQLAYDPNKVYEIEIAKGKYAEALDISLAGNCFARIVINGNEKVEICGASIGCKDTDCIYIPRGTSLEINNLTIENFKESHAIHNDGGDVLMNNVNIIGCKFAVSNKHGGRIYYYGGEWHGKDIKNSIGYRSFFNSTHDFQQKSTEKALKIHNFDRAMLLNEGAQGHLDLIELFDNRVGLNIKRGAGAANTNRMKIYRNRIGVLVENNQWFNNHIQFGKGADANNINVKTYGDSPELAFLNNKNKSRTLRLIETTTQKTKSDIAGLIYQTPDIPDWCMGDNIAHTGRIVILGATKNDNKLELKIKDQKVGEIEVKTGNFKVEFSVNYFGEKKKIISASNNCGDIEIFENDDISLKNIAHNLSVFCADKDVEVKLISFEGTYGG